MTELSEVIVFLQYLLQHLLKMLLETTVVTDIIILLQTATLFGVVWWGAASLASASIFIMFYMVIRRTFIQKQEVSEGDRSAYLRPLIFKCIDDFSYCDVLEKELIDGDRELIIAIIRRLMDTIRGGTRNKLVIILKRFGAIKEHIHNLEAGSWGDRALAALDLAWYEPEDVTTALEKSLDDPSSRVRISAVNSLITLGVQIDVCSIARKFTKPGSRRPRALRTFFRRIAPDSVSELITLLDDNDEGLLILIIDALGYSNNFSILEKIAYLATHHASKDVRAVSIRCLTTLGHPASLKTVKNSLYDVAWEVRTQAAIASGKIGFNETEQRLFDLLSDRHWWVRFRSAEALFTLGFSGRELLKTAMQKGDRTAEIAAQVLAEHAEESA